MKNKNLEILKNIFSILGVMFLILFMVGLFQTNFDNGIAQKITMNVLEEREYIEMITVSIDKFNVSLTKIEETNQLETEGKIVPLKVGHIYKEEFDKMEAIYEILSYTEVPERFTLFHSKLVKAMELKGAAMNEIILYLEDKEPNRLKLVEQYNIAFKTQYSSSITLYNRLLVEKE